MTYSYESFDLTVPTKIIKKVVFLQLFSGSPILFVDAATLNFYLVIHFYCNVVLFFCKEKNVKVKLMSELYVHINKKDL